jgi:hypothetical protein
MVNILGGCQSLGKTKKPSKDGEPWEGRVEDEKLELIAYLYVLTVLMRKHGHLMTAIWIQELLDMVVEADLTKSESFGPIYARHEDLNPWVRNHGKWPENYPEK